MTDTSMADPGAGGDQDAGGDTDAGSDTGGQIIVSICLNSDGSFTLFQGDEPDEGGDDASAGAAPGAAGGAGAAADVGAAPTPPATAGPTGEEDESEAPEGEHFDDVPSLMKAVLEIVKDAADQAGSGESSNMASGFADASGGGAPPTTVQPPGM